jgi:hypothetical protein
MTSRPMFRPVTSANMAGIGVPTGNGEQSACARASSISLTFTGAGSARTACQRSASHQRAIATAAPCLALLKAAIAACLANSALEPCRASASAS